MKKCSYCQEESKDDAIICWNCGSALVDEDIYLNDLSPSPVDPVGSKSRKLVWFSILAGIGLFFLISFFVGSSESPNKKISSSQSRETKLAEALAYLDDVPEIKWIEIDSNTVHLGVDPLPLDIKLIAQAAAFNGNKAINFGVHVWVHPANDKSKYYGETTARYGKIEDEYGR